MMATYKTIGVANRGQILNLLTM